MTERVDAFLARLEHRSVDDLAYVALADPDPIERAALLDRARAVAETAGRAQELTDATTRAGAALVRSFSFRSFEPTWFGVNWGRSIGRAEDRAHLFAAVEDAATAAVIADIEPALADTLGEAFDVAASLEGAAPSANPVIRSLPARSVVATVAIISLLFTGGGAFAAVVAIAVGRRARRGDGD
jgi:hypothetical protein